MGGMFIITETFIIGCGNIDTGVEGITKEWTDKPQPNGGAKNKGRVRSWGRRDGTHLDICAVVGCWVGTGGEGCHWERDKSHCEEPWDGGSGSSVVISSSHGIEGQVKVQQGGMVSIRGAGKDR